MHNICVKDSLALSRAGVDMSQTSWMEGQESINKAEVLNLTIQNMENVEVVLLNEGVLSLLSWLMKFFGCDNWLCNSSIRNAPKRLIQYLTHPVDHYHIFYYVCFGGHTVWFWWALNHLHLPLRKRLKPLRENDASFFLSRWVIFQQFKELLTPHQALFSSPQWCVKM